ncbi:glycine betaine ABC transporter substrate-binding protein [Thermoanaerobacterium butyriciformans]|uniref:Glycine betaine/choline ABC-type transport system substrate-binding protein n=1 Tax=Thermoanaerobacterium butyriciformans TaxID=1702242 RepID=A0ABS4NF50_9THEO|nr:glycine betaine ABC transporter substrate-binding protein [Thermoanaerobacterium butyriciformans]MBP2071650.1 glycine betaine/choline ABC-type transport system substrate-binding protein [Thermoanaerobacterium butyriciformans]MDK2805641.1 osmoprotectant transport system substrate-binding protein [Thermoanaerobacterium sp.]
MRKKIISAILTLVIISALISGCGKSSDTVVIGSKNFTEQIIMGNMLATLIEKNTDLKVDRKLNLGGTDVAFNALKSGDIDMYVEYTGTGLVNILKKPTQNNSDAVYNEVKKDFKEKYNLDWLEPIGFNNTYTLAVSPSVEEKYHPKTISDLKKISNNLVLGCTMEFTERPDGYPGLKKTYDIEFKSVKGMDSGLRYPAIEKGDVDVIDAFSTDGMLKAYNLTVLEDDKNFFPPYYAAPLVRDDTLKKHPELKDVLNKLAGQINDETMRELNYKVDKLGEDPRTVADDFLKSKGLIK